jgi:hypothetical protein
MAGRRAAPVGFAKPRPCAAGHEFIGEGVELRLGDGVDVGAADEVLAQQSVGVPVDAAPPGGVRVTEEHASCGPASGACRSPGTAVMRASTQGPTRPMSAPRCTERVALRGRVAGVDHNFGPGDVGRLAGGEVEDAIAK